MGQHSWAYACAGKPPQRHAHLCWRAKVCSSHAALCLCDIPLNSSNFIKEEQVEQEGAEEKKHKRKEKERREPCFPNHNAHWGFSCGGEGEVNNFVYHGFFFPLLFHFTASLFQAFLFSGAVEKAGWLMQIPSLFTFQSHPFLFREGSPPGN